MTESTFAQQLQTFKTNYAEFITKAEKLSPEQQRQSGICGDWSAREVLAHINGWLIESLRRYPRYAKGTGNIDYNIDAFNSVSLWLRDGKDFEQILEETRRLVDKLSLIANELPEVYIERDKRYAEWLETLSKEAINHGAQLNNLLEATA